jgi:hypothetical protein
MKKIYGLAIVLLLIVSLVPGVLAQEMTQTQEIVAVTTTAADETTDTQEVVAVSTSEVEAEVISSEESLEVDVDEEITQTEVEVEEVETVEESSEVELEAVEELSEAELEDIEEELEVVESEVDEDTTQEVKAMDNTHGKEMRLLQLQKSILHAIYRGQGVIEYAKEQSVDTSNLEIIIDEMNALKNEVANIDVTTDDAVQVFVDLKSDARDLTKQFRDTARELLYSGESLSTEAKDAIKAEFDAIDKSEIDDLNEQIRSRVRNHNAEKLNNYLGKLGVENKDKIVSKYKEGKTNIKEAREQIKNRVVEMSAEEKRKAFSEIKKEHVKAGVAVKAKVDKIKSNIDERKEQRTEKRYDVLEKTSKNVEALKEHKEKRLEEQKKEKQVKEQTIARLKEQKAKVQQRLDTARNRIQNIKENAKNAVQTQKAKVVNANNKLNQVKAKTRAVAQNQGAVSPALSNQEVR